MKRRTGAAIGAGGVLFVAAVAFVGSRHVFAELRSPWFATGWLLAAVFSTWLLLELWRTFRSQSVRPSSPWLGALALGSAALFLVHVDVRLPRGGMEIAMTLVFATFAAGLLLNVLGRLLPLEEAVGARVQRVGRLVYLPAACSLFPLVVLHGLIIHAHGYLAHLSGAHG